MGTKKFIAVLACAVIAATGCSGTKGDAGAAGATGSKGDKGDQGNPGTAEQALTEQCYGCHGATVAAKHATQNLVTVRSETALTAAAADLTMTFNVKVDGVNRNDFLNKQDGYTWTYDPANVTTPGGVRTSLVKTAYTVASTGNGNYTITVPGASATAAGTMFMFRIDTGNSSPQATVVSMVGASTHDTVNNAACMNCHGEYVFSSLNALGFPSQHHSANPKGVLACLFCHNRYDSSESRLGSSGVTGTATGTRLMGYVHGIHNSHNMAAGMGVDLDPSASGTIILVNPDGTYARNGSANSSSWFSIGFPGYMNNCSTCHSTAAELAKVATAPVSWKLCMSCHNDWNGFAGTKSGATQAMHRSFNITTACGDCHKPLGAAANLLTVADAHNGLKTERAGLIYGGADQSVVLGARLKMQITSVEADPDGAGTILVKWTASYDPDADGTFTAVDPCNFDVTAGPVFLVTTAVASTGQVAHNMSIIRSYAYSTSDDWVGGPTATSSPGQPGSVSLTAVGSASANGYTSCASNVATTKLKADTTAAVRGVVGLQGKPQVRFGAIVPAAIGKTYEVIQVRAVSPTYAFNPATLAAVSARRMTVDNAKCLDCHLGSLYQHGGNRVDNVALCDLCHNPASNEGNNRANMGVTAAEAYDGKTGETYDMRTMVHAIHSAGETGFPLVYYRSNGIYFFGTKAALAKVTTWPTAAGGVACKNAEGATVLYAPVYGSVTAGNSVTVNADGTCNTSGPASTGGTWRAHNFIEVHYPQPLNNCGACHADGWTPSLPNPNVAVAVTLDPGVTVTTAPNTPNDDVLIGPAAQSCMTCHQSGDVFTQFGLRSHAYQNGWAPTTFPNGRQTLLDAAP
jgi:OmcA/MtrC family decaheme c-type cytochrome